MLVDYDGEVVDGDAYFIGDETYDGWLFYDTNGNDYLRRSWNGNKIKF